MICDEGCSTGYHTSYKQLLSSFSALTHLPSYVGLPRCATLTNDSSGGVSNYRNFKTSPHQPRDSRLSLTIQWLSVVLALRSRILLRAARNASKMEWGNRANYGNSLVE